MQSKLKLKTAIVWLMIGIPLFCLTLFTWRFCTASINTGELAGKLMLRDFFLDYYWYFADAFKNDPKFPVKIPFNLSNSGHPVIKVKVGQAKEFYAIVDTGAATTLVDVSTAEKASKMGKIECSWGPRKVAYSGDLVRLRDLQISELTYTSLPVFRSKLPAGPMILGNNIFQNYAVTFDFAKMEIMLSGSYEPPIDSTSLPISIKEADSNRAAMPVVGGIAIVECGLDSRKIPFLIDTGSPSTVVQSVFLSTPIPAHDKKAEVNVRAWGYNADWWVGNFNSLQIGTHNLKKPFVFLEQVSAKQPGKPVPYAVIGNDTLTRFKRVTFDWPCHRVIFEPYAAGEANVVGSKVMKESLRGVPSLPESIQRLYRDFNLHK